MPVLPSSENISTARILHDVCPLPYLPSQCAGMWGRRRLGLYQYVELGLGLMSCGVLYRAPERRETEKRETEERETEKNGNGKNGNQIGVGKKGNGKKETYQEQTYY